MTTLTTNPVPTTTSRRPGAGRRTALAVTGFLACALPTVFTITISRMLLTGELDEHRFHQATGQGLILFALWLVPLVGLLRAGWRGERPAAAHGVAHLAFVLTGAVCAGLASGGGATYLVGVIAVTGALVWLALPQRPALRTRVQLHPVLAPVALLVTAVFVPYAADQVALQNAATGHHAQNPHFFDMAWMVASLMVLAVAAAVLPACRRLAAGVAGACVVTGAAGLAFGEGTAWSLLVTGLGLAAGAAYLLTRRTAS